MFVNDMPRYEILSEDAMATLDRGWRRIVSELGRPVADEAGRAGDDDIAVRGRAQLTVTDKVDGGDPER